ncbi:MAG: flagellar basal body-associated FliL family protein, partial [Mesorhizobium sp.]
TNLAAPSEIWIRLEASVLYDAPQPQEMTEQIHQDLLAFVRTLKMHQIEGASGYQHLKADLDERAALRSGGHVKQVLIRTMLLE